MTKVLILDVDDTISPSTISGPRTAKGSMWQGVHYVPNRVLSWFETYETMWLTSWMDGAHDICEAPVLDGPDSPGWWKGNAVNRLLERRLDITHIVWADDEHHLHPDWQPIRDDVRTLLVCPYRGLTDRDADLIERAMA